MSDNPNFENEPDLSDAGIQEGEIDDVDAADLEHSSDEEEGYEPAEPVDLRGPFLDWFYEHFSTVEVSGDREQAPWCPEWWLHPEVNARLWALYLAWVGIQASESVAALSDWWINHWDRHRAVLFDGQTGPFRQCDTARGHLSGQVRKQLPIAVEVTLPPNDWRPPSS